MIHPCDRQTDGRAIAYTRYSIYAVARKNWKRTVTEPLKDGTEQLITMRSSISEGVSQNVHYINKLGLH